MSMEVFFLLGLLAIGIVFSLLTRSIQVKTTADQGMVKAFIFWGAILATGWTFFGGIFVVLNYFSNLPAK